MNFSHFFLSFTKKNVNYINIKNRPHKNQFGIEFRLIDIIFAIESTVNYNAENSKIRIAQFFSLVYKKVFKITFFSSFA